MTAAHAYFIMAPLWMIAANTAPLTSVQAICLALCVLSASNGLFFAILGMQQARKSRGNA